MSDPFAPIVSNRGRMHANLQRRILENFNPGAEDVDSLTRRLATLSTDEGHMKNVSSGSKNYDEVQKVLTQQVPWLRTQLQNCLALRSQQAGDAGNNTDASGQSGGSASPQHHQQYMGSDHENVSASNAAQAARGGSKAASSTANTVVGIDARQMQAANKYMPKNPSADIPLKGQPIQIIGNSIPAKFCVEKKWYQYQIYWKPEIPEDAKNLRADLFKNAAAQLHPTYGMLLDNNTRLFGTIKVKDDTQITVQNRQCILRYVASVDFNDKALQEQHQYAHIALVDLLTRHCGMQREERVYYDTADKGKDKINIDPRLKLPPMTSHLGFRITFESTQEGMALFVDPKHRLMEDRNVREAMDFWAAEAKKECGRLPPHKVKRKVEQVITKHLRGRNIISTYNQQVWRIDDIDFEMDITSMMAEDMALKKGTTLRDYYKNEYGATARNTSPGILIHVPKERKRDDFVRKTYLIPELCHITGVSNEMRKNVQVAKLLATKTRLAADTRKTYSQTMAGRVAQACQRHPQYGFQVEPNLARIDARQLGPTYCLVKEKKDGKMKPTDPLRGKCYAYHASDYGRLQNAWTHSQFIIDGVPLGHGECDWAIVAEADHTMPAVAMQNKLKEKAQEEGLLNLFNKPPKRFGIRINERSRDSRASQWETQLSQKLRGSRIHALFALIPHCKDRDMEEIYGAVKRVCSAEYGIASQCIQELHAENGHVITGIMRQMFTKLGAVPWLIKFKLPDNKLSLRRMMLVGLDVNHDRRNTQSTIGIAASFDRNFVKYFTMTDYQELAQDMIKDLDKHICTCLDNFKKMNNGVLPENIMLWRDGVSATQIETLIHKEVQAIKNGIKKYYTAHQNNMPGFAVIVVQKRIVHRFTTAEGGDSAPPGTLIANKVTSNQFWDYFLVSCEPPEKATATPTRYIVAEDMGMNLNQCPNDLYHFTNQLCNMYFNWPGPIRVPAPVKYANKLAQQFGQSCNSLEPHKYLVNTPHFL